jgi:hypothetical protein
VSTVVAYAIFERIKNAGEIGGFYAGLKLTYGHSEIPSSKMFTSEGLESRRFKAALNEVSSPIRIHRTYRIQRTSGNNSTVRFHMSVFEYSNNF